MKTKIKWAFAIVTASVTFIGITLAAQDKYTIKALNGVGFSEFRGYESWETVAVSVTDEGMNSILGNPAMIKAYKDGIPANGQPFPDGAAIAKIEWRKRQNPISPYSVDVPNTLRRVSFIEKDSKRFPDSSGWGYAQFLYDTNSASFKPFGEDSSFGTKVCYQCHKAAKETDYIFTGYPLR